MKKYFKRFIHEESGAELIEFAIIIGIVAVLIIPVLGIAGTAKSKVEQAQGELEDAFNQTGRLPSGGSGTPSTTGGGTGSGVSTE